MPGLPSTPDTSTLSFPPSNWLLILINLSGWDFLWLLNEASAIWPSALEPKNGILTEQQSLPEQPPKPHCHSRCQKTQQSQGSVNIPSHIPCFSLVPLAGTTENGVTPGAQLKQALQRQLLTVVQKGQSQIPGEKPHRGLLNRDTTCGLESATCKSQKDFREKTTTCLSWCLLLARKGDFAQLSNLDLCPPAGSERHHQQSPVSTWKPLQGKDDPAGTFSLQLTAVKINWS